MTWAAERAAFLLRIGLLHRNRAKQEGRQIALVHGLAAGGLLIMLPLAAALAFLVMGFLLMLALMWPVLVRPVLVRLVLVRLVGVPLALMLMISAMARFLD